MMAAQHSLDVASASSSSSFNATINNQISPSSCDVVSPLTACSSSSQPNSPAADEPTDSEICVFLADQNGINMHFPIPSSQITCEQILIKLNRCLHERDPKQSEPEAKRLFSLWMDSPLLELQLKAQHRPFCLLRRWDALLAQFAAVGHTVKQLKRDSPALSYRRDVFATISVEQSIQSPLAIRLLMEEAMDNVRRGRYPLDDESAISLAGLAIRALYPPFENLSTNQLSQMLHNVLPTRMLEAISGTLSFGRQRSKLAQKVLEQYIQLPAKDQLTQSQAQLQALEMLRALPVYGSAFFEAQVERPVSTFAALISHPDLKVWIAINTIGLHLISRKTPVTNSTVKLKTFNLC